MNSKEKLALIKETWYDVDLTDEKYIDFDEEQIFSDLEKDLDRLDYYDKIKLMLKQKECVLRYVESEDCFAVKGILDENWYKLSKDFVENNIKEEIKPLPLIVKVKELKEKVEKQDKILEILKRVIFLTNNSYYIQTKKRLNEEDYKLIKEWLENEKNK